mgnify:CR=1 FL=1
MANITFNDALVAGVARCLAIIASGTNPDGSTLVLSAGIGVSSAVVSGTLTVSSTTAVPLATSTNISEVIIQNAASSLSPAIIGSATSQAFILYPGSELRLLIGNLNLIWAKAPSGGNFVLNYIARV